MALTTTDLAAIDRAIASGSLLVDFGDRKVRFDDFEGLMKRKREILAEINGRTDDGSFPMNVSRVLTNSGL
jgi:hypothetical protein